MSDLVHREFEVHISRIIRAIPASARRKRMWRSEMFNHLAECFYAERPTQSDAYSAAQAAIKRFGDPDEIRGQLRVTVPTLEKFVFDLFGRKEKEMRRLISIASIVMIVLVVGWLALCATMISHELFRQYPPGSSISARADGGLDISTKYPDGSVIITGAEPFKPTIIPAMVVPFFVLVGFAILGWANLGRRKATPENTALSD